MLAGSHGDDIVSVSSSELSAEDATAKKCDFIICLFLVMKPKKSFLLGAWDSPLMKTLTVPWSFNICPNSMSNRSISLAVKKKKPFQPIHKHLLVDEIEC